MTDIVARVDNVSKKFSRTLTRSMVYGVQDITRNLMGMGTRSDRLRRDEFWAVKDVSFDLKKGECLGIIGANGSGKSTMLKMLNGIFMPDKGRIEIKGRVGALIELGAGFHPMLTGRENVYINGAVLGMGRKEIDLRFDEIVDFADIGDFLDTPVKNYSSGMLARLGFAIAAHCKTDILLIDEVLSVGDENFREKSLAKIRGYLEGGGTAIFVSHSLPSVRIISDKVALFLSGKISSLGSPDDVIKTYIEYISGKHSTNDNDSTSLEITIDSVDIINTNNASITEFEYGQSANFRINYTSFKKINRPYFFIQIYKAQQMIISYNMIRSLGDWAINEGKGFVELYIPQLFLSPGKYDIFCGIQNKPTSQFGQKFYVHPHYYVTFEVNTTSFRNKLNISSDLVGFESLSPIYLPFKWRLPNKEIR